MRASTFGLLAAIGLFLCVPSVPAEAKTPRPTPGVIALMRETQTILKTSAADYKQASTALRKSNSELTRRLRSGATAPDAAADEFIPIISAFELVNEDRRLAETVAFITSFDATVLAHPGDQRLVRQLDRGSGGLGDVLFGTQVRQAAAADAEVDKAAAAFRAAMECAGRPITFARLSPTTPTHPMDLVLDRAGTLQYTGAYRTRLQSCTATCDGTLTVEFEIPSHAPDKIFHLRLRDAAGATVAERELLTDDGAELVQSKTFTGVAPGTYRLSLHSGGPPFNEDELEADVAYIVVPAWPGVPAEPVCGPTSTISLTVDSQPVTLPPFVSLGLQDFQGSLIDFDAQFGTAANPGPGFVRTIMSLSIEGVIVPNSPESRRYTTTIPLPQGQTGGIFANIRIPGAAANVTDMTANVVATNLGNLLGSDPAKCAEIAIDGTIGTESGIKPFQLLMSLRRGTGPLKR